MLRKQNCCTELSSLGHLDIRVIPIGLSVSGTYGCVDGEKGGEGVWSLGGWCGCGGYVRGVGMALQSLTRGMCELD